MVGRTRGAARRPGRRPHAGRLAAGAALGHRPAPGPGVPRPRPRRAARRRRAATTGPFKLQAAGPWTLAAGLERTPGRARGRRRRRPSRPRAVAGRGPGGARRRGRAPGCPGRQVVVQLDEPSVPAVLQGGAADRRAASASCPPSRRTVVEQELARRRRRRCPVPVVVHCCAPRMPLDLFRAAGAAGALVRPRPGPGPRRGRRGRRGGHPPAAGRRPGHRRRAARAEGDRLPRAGVVARARLRRRRAARRGHAHAGLRPGRRDAGLRARRRWPTCARRREYLQPE